MGTTTTNKRPSTEDEVAMSNLLADYKQRVADALVLREAEYVIPKRLYIDALESLHEELSIMIAAAREELADADA